MRHVVLVIGLIQYILFGVQYAGFNFDFTVFRKISFLEGGEKKGVT